MEQNTKNDPKNKKAIFQNFVKKNVFLSHVPRIQKLGS